MALRSRVELKAYLQKGDKPKETEFSDLLDMTYLKSEEKLFAKGGDVFGENAKIGLVDNFALDFITGNQTRMRIHSNGRRGFGTITDAGYDNDFSGSSRFAGLATFNGHQRVDNDVRGLYIVNRNSLSIKRDVVIGDNVTSINTSDINYLTGNRVIVGTNNTWNNAYNKQIIHGIDNTVTINSNAFYVFGEGNQILDGDSNLSVFGYANIVNYPQSSQARNMPCAIGGGNRVLHKSSLVVGSYGETTADYQLIFTGYQSNNSAAGLKDVYFGTGVRTQLPGTPPTFARAGVDVTLNGSGAGDAADLAGGKIRIAGGKGTGTGTPGDIVFVTPAKAVAGSTLQTLTERWWVKGDTGRLGNTSSPTSQLDVTATNGYNQLRLRTQYTPSATADPNGSQGDVCFDNSYLYYKTSTGWKRSALSTF